ncbi:ATP-binding protein [Coleofasciculus sp. FACHB-1120]|uniref:GAF domain-containing sensor histidine kinase n=1 Tax=Coleofasciculus sp. FACHB-1120 TaxID=2692783 RepID=UPI0016882D0A|nr:ATP-binding protein [Coleofasciculus sp. FACHB-1120]MBD2740513.1 GAF domain-containing protein [Coleofasciculus sp. FACHB-1120]
MTEQISEQHQTLLTQIARSIHRTLDLKAICQQTVESLGKTLDVSRCFICHQISTSKVQVVAEYSHEPSSLRLDREIEIAECPYLSLALASLEPIVVENIDEGFQRQSILAVASLYQEQPNGLIILQQYASALGSKDESKDRRCPRQWSAAEIELMGELSEQVGTAIARANLYQQLQQARQLAETASCLKTEFLSTISHELRTPLNGIICSLKLILDDLAEDRAEQQEFMNDAHSSALRLMKSVNDILAIAKFEAERNINLTLDAVNLNELLSEVERLRIPLALQKHLNLQIEKPKTLDEIILYANYRGLLQVLLNLVDNAIKFTREGEITINTQVIQKTVRFDNQELPGMVVVTVADTGIGVPEDKRDRLFQLFGKVNGSHTTPYAGTGLGLTISQKLIEAMGGNIHFHSYGEGLGSTVMFTVPLYQAPVMITTPQTYSIELLI